MAQTREVSLEVNSSPIPIDYFVQGFIDHVVAGILGSLEGTGEIQEAEFTIEGEEVRIELNGAPVPINPFVTKIVKSTLVGMVSSLKGVDGVQTLRIKVKRAGAFK